MQAFHLAHHHPSLLKSSRGLQTIGNERKKRFSISIIFSIFAAVFNHNRHGKDYRKRLNYIL